MNDDAYDELLETVNWNLSFKVEPTPAQWAALLPDDASEIRAFIEDEKRNGTWTEL